MTNSEFSFKGIKVIKTGPNISFDYCVDGIHHRNYGAYGSLEKGLAEITSSASLKSNHRPVFEALYEIVKTTLGDFEKTKIEARKTEAKEQ